MPSRIQMTRQRPWRPQHPDAVIVARPTKWGNPWTKQDWYWLEGENWREIAVMCFRFMFQCNQDPAYRPRTYPTDEEIRTELAGRDLACWCPLDEPCHADVLLTVANFGAEVA